MIAAYLIFGIFMIVLVSMLISRNRAAMSEQMIHTLLLVALVIYLGSFILIVFFIIFIYRALNQIVTAAASYAKGDYSVPLDIERSDEIGQLGIAMNFMAQKLNDLEEDQRKFISNVSHDFRSPLTSIKGYAQAIEDGTIPPELQNKYLDVIIFETERLSKLTENLLELNKYGAKGFFLEIRSFDINELIRQTVGIFEGSCREKRITLEVDLVPGVCMVKADPGRIDQVLHNLIDNAIKFSEPDSTVTISTVAKNEKIFVSVRDSGIGIPKSSQSRIWERFYKTDLSRGKDKKGTGLGLSIVWEIIHAHKENINVISTEGVGSEFIFTLTPSKETV